MALTHMSLGMLQGTEASADWGLEFPWCPSCLQMTAPEFLLALGTFFAIVSIQFVGKCQTLTYIKFWTYVGL